jgi:hypothetical protein
MKMNPDLFRRDFHYHVKIGHADIFAEFGSPGRLDINLIYNNVEDAYNKFISTIESWYPDYITSEDKDEAYQIIKQYSDAVNADFMINDITPDTYLDDFVQFDAAGVPIEIFPCAYCEPYYYN